MKHIGGVDILKWCQVFDRRWRGFRGQTDLQAAKGLIHKALQMNQYINLDFKKAPVTYLEVCV